MNFIDLDNVVSSEKIKSDSEVIRSIQKQVKYGIDVLNIPEVKNLYKTIDEFMKPYRDYSESISTISNAYEKIRFPVSHMESLISKSFENNIKQLTAIAERNKEITISRAPLYDELFKKLDACNWVITGGLDFFVIINSYKKSPEDLSHTIFKEYKKNNYKMLFDDLDEISNYISRKGNKGFQLEVDEINKYLKLDISYFHVFIPALINVLQHVYECGYGVARKKFVNKEEVQTKQKEKHKELDSNDIMYFYQKNEYLILSNMVRLFTSQKFDTEIENNTFSRHTVAHSKYDLSKFSIEDMLKLISLIAGICFQDD